MRRFDSGIQAVVGLTNSSHFARRRALSFDLPSMVWVIAPYHRGTSALRAVGHMP